ncbi:MAG: hypothetical protein LBH68_08315 [Bifidobacteriaceae bacterium]|nr:hypothetical protein [Bifidobacteriaceae bacterium]
MEVKVAVGQLAPTEDARANWEAAARLAEAAAQAGASLLILPEQTMLAGRAQDPGRFAALAGAAWDWWPAQLAQAAQSLDISIVAGGFAPGGAAQLGLAEGPRAAMTAGGAPDKRPFNVLLAVDSSGQLVACQPKIHLYDAFTFAESDMVRPGSPAAAQVLELAGLKLGLVNCYELRFPERARALALAGAEALTVSAAWVRGPLKEDHWNTLLRARAIENCAYVLAAGTRAKDTIGRSQVIDPGGVTVAGLGVEAEGLATAVVNTGLIESTREATGSV